MPFPIVCDHGLEIPESVHCPFILFLLDPLLLVCVQACCVFPRIIDSRPTLELYDHITTICTACVTVQLELMFDINRVLNRVVSFLFNSTFNSPTHFVANFNPPLLNLLDPSSSYIYIFYITFLIWFVPVSFHSLFRFPLPLILSYVQRL